MQVNEGARKVQAPPPPPCRPKLAIQRRMRGSRVVLDARQRGPSRARGPPASAAEATQRPRQRGARTSRTAPKLGPSSTEESQRLASPVRAALTSTPSGPWPRVRQTPMSLAWRGAQPRRALRARRKRRVAASGAIRKHGRDWHRSFRLNSCRGRARARAAGGKAGGGGGGDGGDQRGSGGGARVARGPARGRAAESVAGE